MKKENVNTLIILFPMLFSFFIMGYVDFAGIASNYIKADFGLSDSIANLFPSFLFLWFFVLSVPAGMLMDRIGRKKTVLLSILITVISLIFPLLDYSLPMMVVSFCFLGIGNTLMQVSLNPLIAGVVSGEKLAGALTLGQFAKNIMSFITPFAVAWLSVKTGDWKMIYPVFIAIGIFGAVILYADKNKEKSTEKKISSFKESLLLLGDKTILMFFIAIMCHVGIDIGVNVTSPKIFMEYFGFSLAGAVSAAGTYFLFKIIGSLAGAFLLSRYRPKYIFITSTLVMTVSLLCLLAAGSVCAAYICVAAIGLGNSNIFSIVVSKALTYKTDKQNEISGLMITGLIGGGIFLILSGISSDILSSQAGAIAIMIAGASYLLIMSLSIKHINK